MQHLLTDLFASENEKIYVSHLRSFQDRDETNMYFVLIFFSSNCMVAFIGPKKLIFFSLLRMKVSISGSIDYLISRTFGEIIFSAKTRDESKRLVEALRVISRKVFECEDLVEDYFDVYSILTFLSNESVSSKK